MLYKFKKPFKYGTETVESVELKEDFDTGDMIRVANAKGDGDKVGTMLVAATGWPLPKVAKIPLVDYFEMTGIVADFFNDLPIPSLKDGSEML